jgi:hypothetical protein
MMYSVLYKHRVVTYRLDRGYTDLPLLDCGCDNEQKEGKDTANFQAIVTL